MSGNSGISGASEASPYSRPGYRWYALGVLTLVYACHALDRGLPNILIEPVRHEFNLSDSQLGLFSGMAFGVAFFLTGFPMGYLSDRVPNRRNMLALVVLAWSALTALGGFAKSFMHLIIVRFGLGAAEAGTAPLTMPMLSDIFPPHQRATALGIFYTSQPIGGFLATALGGYIAAEYGWRAAFFIAGIPGLIAAILVYTTLRDPRRGEMDEKPAENMGAAENGGQIRMRDAFVFLRQNPALLALMFGCAMLGLLSITLGAWVASFFMRVHNLGLAETGFIIGASAAFSSITSPMAFGWLADKLAPGDARWPLRLIWLASLGSMAFTMAQLFVPVLSVVVVCFILSEALRVGYAPPTYSVLLNRTPSNLRGSVMSLLQLFTALMGFGVGPLLTGALSDYFGGGTAIKYAMAVVSILFVVASISLIVASRGLYGRKGGKPA